MATTTQEKPKTTRTRCGKELGDGKKCALGKGHDHGPNATEHRPYQRKTFAPIASVPTLVPVPENAEPVKVNQQTRTELQTTFDGFVKANHDNWIKLGKPADFNAPKVRGLFIVDPGEAASYRAALENSGRYLDLFVQMPSMFPRNAEGKVLVYFVAKDRRTRRNNQGSGTADAPRS
jgi:hypothetical protein